MPSDHLVSSFVVCFVPCAPRNVALSSVVELFLIVNYVLIILGSFFILLFILIVERLVKLSVSLIIQIISCDLRLLAIKSAAGLCLLRALTWHHARATSPGSKVGGSRCGLLIELI